MQVLLEVLVPSRSGFWGKKKKYFNKLLSLIAHAKKKKAGFAISK